ncbi:MAG TPA: lytic transglycosylase domain-containing protein [Sphingomonas sp.]|nr:lytic transglycosylase domain-containing protein [Sphingomonas sp.]
MAGASIAAPAAAQVLSIGPDGGVVTQDRPALYLGDTLHPQPILPSRAPPSAREAAPGDVHGAIRAAAARHGVSPALVSAVAWRESRFNQAAVSPKGARGVMQLMPGTARALGVDARDAGANVEGGAAYLGRLIGRYHGDIVKALAAYNAGPGAVDRWRGVPPFAETRAYVAAILDRMAALAERGTG